MASATNETHWEKAAKTKMGIYLTKAETNFIFNALNLMECSLIVDVGSEAGRFSTLAAKKKVDVIAIDKEVCGLKRLRSKNKLVDVVLADARSLPLRENVFDAAFMIEVLDYIPELEIVLTECRKILKSGGSLVFSFGNKRGLKSRLRQLRGKSYLHSYHEVIRSLDKVGLRVVRKEGFNWLPFSRMSENSLIPLLAKIERLLGLRKLPNVSPWVIIHAIKSK